MFSRKVWEREGERKWRRKRKRERRRRKEIEEDRGCRPQYASSIIHVNVNTYFAGVTTAGDCDDSAGRNTSSDKYVVCAPGSRTHFAFNGDTGIVTASRMLSSGGAQHLKLIHVRETSAFGSAPFCSPFVPLVVLNKSSECASSVATISSAPPLAAGDFPATVSEEQTLLTFKTFDSNDNGYISRIELHHAMNSIDGAAFTDEEVDAMISEADLDGDDQINYKEFVRLMLSEQE